MADDRPSTDQPGADDRRSAPRPGSDDRRRTGWRDFRHGYPGFVLAFAIAVAGLLAADGWLLWQRWRYRGEIDRLRAGMSEAERRRTDIALSVEENRTRVMLELIRRQASGDAGLHLSVAVDSATMYLERDGVSLRDMQVEVGAERVVGTAPDTVRLVAPRGARTIERLLGPKAPWEVPRWVFEDRGLPVPEDRAIPGALGAGAIVVTGGTVIYARPAEGPLADSAYVLPGSLRLSPGDLRAIMPNLKPGMTVYFY